jgi:hypothetical protein
VILKSAVANLTRLLTDTSDAIMLVKYMIVQSPGEAVYSFQKLSRRPSCYIAGHGLLATCSRGLQARCHLYRLRIDRYTVQIESAPVY